MKQSAPSPKLSIQNSNLPRTRWYTGIETKHLNVTQQCQPVIAYHTSKTWNGEKCSWRKVPRSPWWQMTPRDRDRCCVIYSPVCSQQSPTKMVSPVALSLASEEKGDIFFIDIIFFWFSTENRDKMSCKADMNIYYSYDIQQCACHWPLSSARGWSKN